MKISLRNVKAYTESAFKNNKGTQSVEYIIDLQMFSDDSKIKEKLSSEKKDEIEVYYSKYDIQPSISKECSKVSIGRSKTLN